METDDQSSEMELGTEESRQLALVPCALKGHSDKGASVLPTTEGLQLLSREKLIADTIRSFSSAFGGRQEDLQVQRMAVKGWTLEAYFFEK